MVIFELPREADATGLRGCSLGSCRVRIPLDVLSRLGGLRLCGGGLSATHTAAEALQAVDFIAGALEIPQPLNPYIFAVKETPSTAQLARLLEGGLDVSLLEICDDKQFSFGAFQLQQNFVATMLVRPHRGSLLAWFRQVCEQGMADEAMVEITLEKVREGGGPHDDAIAALLRGVHLRRQTADEICADIASLMARISGRWVVIGAFDIPGEEGEIMRNRRALNGKLEDAATRCGAFFYDPSRLVAEHGRERALAGAGADIYEFADDFLPIVGETLVSLARGPPPAGRSDVWAKAERATGGDAQRAKVLRSQLADAVNGELVALHGRRLELLGLEVSGLYEHYSAIIGRGALVGNRERAAFDLISSHLPPYDSFAVLRGGIGELALLLAASGKQVTTYEPHPHRRAAIEAGIAHLEGVGLLAPGALTLVGTDEPEIPRTGRILGVGLEAIFVYGPDPGARHLPSMYGYEALLIDLRMFLWLRESPPDQDDAAAELALMGFDRRRDYPLDGLTWFCRSRADVLP